MWGVFLRAAELVVSDQHIEVFATRPTQSGQLIRRRCSITFDPPNILGLSQCKSSQEVGVAFADFVAPYGFVATACGESRDTPEGRRWEFFFNTWPAEWLLQYQKSDFVRHDLLPMVARFSAQTFTWLEALRG